MCREVSVQLIRTPTLDQQATELVQKKTCKTRTPTQHWVSDEIRRAIAAGSVGNRRLECRLILGEGAKGERRMRIHARQHWTMYYCPCGVGKRSRHIIAQHQRDQQYSSRHSGSEGCINEVDAEHYGAFCQQYRLPSLPVAAYCPCLKAAVRPR